MSEVSEKKRLPALLLCFFLGCLGIHRFYVNRIGSGILWLLTSGLFGIGALVDFIMIIVGTFKDKEGKIRLVRIVKHPVQPKIVSGRL